MYSPVLECVFIPVALPLIRSRHSRLGNDGEGESANYELVIKMQFPIDSWLYLSLLTCSFIAALTSVFWNRFKYFPN